MFDKQGQVQPDQLIKQKSSVYERALAYSTELFRLDFIKTLFVKEHLFRNTKEQNYFHALIEGVEAKGIKLPACRIISETMMNLSPSHNGMGRDELLKMLTPVPAYGMLGTPYEEKGGIIEWIKNKLGGGGKRE